MTKHLSYLCSSKSLPLESAFQTEKAYVGYPRLHGSFSLSVDLLLIGAKEMHSNLTD